MYEKIANVMELTHEEWLKLRKTGIGGSDAGAVLGVNPYKSPMHVFYEKTCTESAEEEEKEAVRIGHDLEEYVAARFCEATGFKVRRSNFMYRSIENPFMIADVDRMIVGEDAGLECKTTSAYGADNWKDGDIPLPYIFQAYHYMAVTGKRTWYIACVILGREFVYRKLMWDADLIERMIRVEENFWNEYVLKGIIPAPDGSEACDEALKQYYGAAQKGRVIALTGFDEKLERHQKLREQIETLSMEQKQIEQEVKLFMAENETAVSPKFRVKWSNVESTRIDTGRLKEELPEVYKNYGKTINARSFTIKAA